MVSLVKINDNIIDYNVLIIAIIIVIMFYNCCEANQLLDLNTYRFKKTTITNSSNCKDNGDSNQ
jgi:hypothetical protein